MLMMRHRRVEEAPSKLAIWSRAIAIFSLPVVLLAVIIVRSGFLEIVPGLAILGGALFLAVIAVVVALGALVIIWREGLEGAGFAMTALSIGFLILAYPAYFAVLGYRLPAIYDVSSDPVDPPRFEAVARLRSRDANPIAYPGARAANLQRAAYRDVEPLMLGATPQETYDAVLALMTKRKWRVVDARQPQGKRRDGHIEAVARTPIMGFRDDVVVRIHAAEDETRVDMRSASRFGHHDFGTNASRIRSFLEDLDEATSNEERKKQTQKAAKSTKPQVKKAHAPARR
jgi:uncharacterized protein (DUF1499 family)